MVAVVQLVEHQVVILVVAGSSPVSHPDTETPPTRVGGVFGFGSIPLPMHTDPTVVCTK